MIEQTTTWTEPEMLDEKKLKRRAGQQSYIAVGEKP